MATSSLTLESPIGALRVDAEDGAVVGVYLEGEWPFDDAPSALRSGRTGDEPRHPVLAAAAEQLAAWFAGRLRSFDLPLRLQGTPFQRAVWEELLRIPFGETRTYGDIAGALGRPSASRAVGAANGRNPISIIVPCHRVIGASGALTGYAGGLSRKRWLLEHERAVLAR